MTEKELLTPATDPAQLTLSRLLTVQELADLLQVPSKTIYAWRYKGVGPRGVPVGRYLRFKAEDVSAWLETLADRRDETRGP